MSIAGSHPDASVNGKIQGSNQYGNLQNNPGFRYTVLFITLSAVQLSRDLAKSQVFKALGTTRGRRLFGSQGVNHIPEGRCYYGEGALLQPRKMALFNGRNPEHVTPPPRKTDSAR